MCWVASNPWLKGGVAEVGGDPVTIDLRGPTACSVAPPDERAAIIARLGPDLLDAPDMGAVVARADGAAARRSRDLAADRRHAGLVKDLHH